MSLAPTRCATTRVSGYVIGEKLPGSEFYILMHGYTGALDKVPAEIGEWLVTTRGRAVDNGDLEYLGDENQRYFASRGYLTELDPEAEREVLLRITTALHERDLESSRTGFMFIPTYMCNLRCAYCFQSHVLHAGRGPWSAVLTTEQVDYAFEIMTDFEQPGAMARALGLTAVEPVAAAGRPLSDIGLFGGEPLLEATLPVVSYIVERAGEQGRAVSAITNAVDLHAFADLLGPGRLQELQVTLDGPADLHDRRRVGPGLRATFDTIVSGIELALERKVEIAVRINVDESNIDGLERLDDYFQSRGWNDVPHFRVEAAAVTADGRHQPLITQAMLMEKTRMMREERQSPIRSYEQYARDALTKCLMADGEYPFTHVANCAAETGLLMFDARGHVYSCWEDVGHPDLRVGAYGAAGLELDEEKASVWLTRFPGAIEECSRCPYALIHSSGCAAHARKQTGTIFANACESFKEYFPASLAETYAEFEAELMSTEMAATTSS